MKKYNLSDIMKTAWSTYRKFAHVVHPIPFDECLRRAWKAAKEALALAAKMAQNVIHIVVDGVHLNLYHTFIPGLGRMGYALFGKTYDLRKTLRRADFGWDCEGKMWFTADKAVAERFVRMYA